MEYTKVDFFTAQKTRTITETVTVKSLEDNIKALEEKKAGILALIAEKEGLQNVVNDIDIEISRIKGELGELKKIGLIISEEIK